MNYVPSKGGTLLIPSGSYNDPERKHLFIICTDECQCGEFILVPVSSWKEGIKCDPTCRLSQEDGHPFIKRESYVLYREAKTLSGEQLKKGFNRFEFIKKENISECVLQRVYDGILKSPHTKRRIKSMLK